jgi:Circadian oscillating protein COP23
MKIIATARILLTFTTATSILLFCGQLVRSQLPPIVDNTPSGLIINDRSNSSDRSSNGSGSGLRVSCQGLQTIVQKGDRQAVMLSWNYDGFGREYTPEKRCQIVSERLQQAAERNGGTFKDLQLASGIVNSQTVICALSFHGKCNRKNMLFTLKPENARNPESVIQKMLVFAQDGSAYINESATNSRPQITNNLGMWEQKAFGQSQNSSTPKRRTTDTGF